MFGKTVDEIQDDIDIDDYHSKVTVSPIEIDEAWTEFSSIPSEQLGYYMAFEAGVEGAATVDVIMRRNGIYNPAKKAHIVGSKDDVIIFLGADAATAKGADGIKVVGYDANNKQIGLQVYDLDVKIA